MLGLGIRCGVAREHTYAEEKYVWSGRGEDGKEEQNMGQSTTRRATPNARNSQHYACTSAKVGLECVWLDSEREARTFPFTLWVCLHSPFYQHQIAQLTGFGERMTD
ncbi:hypothetical protein Ddc_06674 [Ditylenchus destructor]|nr:hypothetical protein Ddc_06674 [Ditylenchus destructor]